MFTYQYPHPAATVDCVVFGLADDDLNGLLIQRDLEEETGVCLRSKVHDGPIVFEFLTAKFTLRRLQSLYETILGTITGDVLGSVYEGAMIKRKDFRLLNYQSRPAEARSVGGWPTPPWARTRAGAVVRRCGRVQSAGRTRAWMTFFASPLLAELAARMAYSEAGTDFRASTLQE